MIKKNLKQVTKDKLSRQLLGFTEQVEAGMEKVTEECKAKEERIQKLELENLFLKRSLEEHADHITVVYSKIEELSLFQKKARSG